jgi:hypothetical protein
MPKTPEQIRLYRAHLGTQGATARLQGMKLRAQIEPPRAAEGTFPYPHRTCAQWTAEEREMAPYRKRRAA